MHELPEHVVGKLEELEKEYVELEHKLADPKIFSSGEKYSELAKRYGEIGELVTEYRRYKELLHQLEEAEEIISEGKDEELIALARSEAEKAQEELAHLTRSIQEKLIGGDEDESRSVIMEIRAGAGGEEASLFAADLFRMYERYAEKKGWKIDVMDSHPTELGGFSKVIFGVRGRGAYRHLKHESGVHRVQRVPVTESSGRIHTSTCTVAVLPEVEDVEVKIDPKDLKIETFRASGPGGQHVNMTDSAVRITHIPTGIVVSCQDERDQRKNRAKAMRILRARLYELYKREQEEEIAEARRSQIGSGERSEKVRTYNFPQNRVTDHRINLTLYRLEEVLKGELDEIIEALIAHDAEIASKMD